MTRVGNASCAPVMVLATASLMAACIPDDTTIARGGIALHFEPNDMMKRGAAFTSADGWRVVFERTMVSLEALPGEGCNYKEADFGGIVYDARNPLTTLIRGAEAGECKYFVAVRGGLRFARAGAGVTKAEQVAFSRAADAVEVPYALRYVGTATYGQETIRFDFGVAVAGFVMNYRTRVPDFDKVDTSFTVRPEEIFRATLLGGAGPLMFPPVWLADQRGNHDGIVTNDELDRTRVSRDGSISPGADVPLSTYFSARARSIFRLDSLNVGEPPVVNPSTSPLDE